MVLKTCLSTVSLRYKVKQTSEIISKNHPCVFFIAVCIYIYVYSCYMFSMFRTVGLSGLLHSMV